MSAAPQRIHVPWHPFTPKGAAGAACAPRWQLWTALLLTGGLAIASLLHFFAVCWSPVIEAAIAQLDDGSVIRRGILHPAGSVTVKELAGNRHLQINLQWNPNAGRDDAADVRLALQIDRLQLCSLFGCLELGYERLGDVRLGRTETGAWWRAWRLPILVAVAVAFSVFLLLSWWLLTVVYAWGIRLLAFYLDRAVDFAGAGRVAQASLIPGAVWVAVALALHARDQIDLLTVLVVYVLHLPVGWLYVVLACRHLPARPDVTPVNPFQAATPAAASATASNPEAPRGEESS